MTPYKIHYWNLDGSTFCGFRNRLMNSDLRNVNCLLCLRAVISRARAALQAATTTTPVETPALQFEGKPFKQGNQTK